MKQKFLSNLLFLILANLIIKPFWIFGIDRHLQNTIDTSAYGAYFAVFNFAFLLHIILDGGINNYNNIEVSRDPQYAKQNLSNLLYLKLLLSFFYIAITVMLASFTSFDPEQFHMLFILMLNMILLNLILFFRSNVAALHYFKVDSLLSVLDRFLAILICLLLILSNQLSVINFIYAQSISLLLTLITSAFVVNHIARPALSSWDKKIFVKILRESYPFALLGILMTIYYRIDAVMIEQLLPNGKEQAGIYAASYRLLDALNMIAFLVASLLLPIFSKSIKAKDINYLKKLIQQSSGILLLLSVTVFLLSFIYSDWIMTKLYIHATDSWHRTFWTLLFSFIPISLTYVFGTFLTANKSIRFLNYLSLGALLLNIGLNLLWIPKYEAYGACLATGITQVFVVSIQISYVVYLLYFSTERLNYENSSSSTS